MIKGWLILKWMSIFKSIPFGFSACLNHSLVVRLIASRYVHLDKFERHVFLLITSSSNRKLLILGSWVQHVYCFRNSRALLQYLIEWSCHKLQRVNNAWELKLELMVSVTSFTRFFSSTILSLQSMFEIKPWRQQLRVNSWAQWPNVSSSSSLNTA